MGVPAIAARHRVRTALITLVIQILRQAIGE
jgi:hypothetical protein